MWAYIYNEVVVELTELDPTGRFDDSMIWVDITTLVPMPEQGWSYSAGTFAPPPPPPPPSAGQLLAEKLAIGITVASTGDPALNAVYALDSASTAQIFQLGLFASQFETFPGGASQSYPDATGTMHSFSVTQFVSFLRAVAPLVSALTTQAGIMAQGGTPVWPTQSVTIP